MPRIARLGGRGDDDAGDHEDDRHREPEPKERPAEPDEEEAPEAHPSAPKRRPALAHRFPSEPEVRLGFGGHCGQPQRAGQVRERPVGPEVGVERPDDQVDEEVDGEREDRGVDESGSHGRPVVRVCPRRQHLPEARQRKGGLDEDGGADQEAEVTTDDAGERQCEAPSCALGLLRLTNEGAPLAHEPGVHHGREQREQRCRDDQVGEPVAGAAAVGVGVEEVAVAARRSPSELESEEIEHRDTEEERGKGSSDHVARQPARTGLGSSPAGAPPRSRAQGREQRRKQLRAARPAPCDRCPGYSPARHPAIHLSPGARGSAGTAAEAYGRRRNPRSRGSIQLSARVRRRK